MESVNFKEVTNKIAEHQEEFNTVYSQWNPEDQSINICFELTDAEIVEILTTKKIWYKQQIGPRSMHPMRISVFKDEIIKSE